MSTTSLTVETRELLGTKTKGKILTASLGLFNAQGFDRVTTAQIAKAAEVLDGTLWYHFKAKNDLALAHLAALETRLDLHLTRPVPQPEGLVFKHFETVFDLLWDFRYLLRDPLQALLEDSANQRRLRDIYTKLEQQGQARLRQAAALNLINLEGVDIEKLARTCLMIGRYWLDFAAIRYVDEVESPKLRARGIAQLLFVLNPYFTETTRAFIDKLTESRSDD